MSSPSSGTHRLPGPYPPHDPLDAVVVSAAPPARRASCRATTTACSCTRGRSASRSTSSRAPRRARWCALNALSVLRAELGTLDRIERVLTVLGFVAWPGLRRAAGGRRRREPAARRRVRRRRPPHRSAIGVAALPAAARSRSKSRSRSDAEEENHGTADHDHRRRQLPVGTQAARRPREHAVAARGRDRARRTSTPRRSRAMVELVEHIAAVARHRPIVGPSTTDQRAGARRRRLRRRQHLDRRVRAACATTSRSRSATGSSSRSATPSVRAAIIRALRNIPVLVGIARDMEELCPDAWLLNITNPMTTLCRAVTRETTIKTVGLCHEIAVTQFVLSHAARRRLPSTSTSTIAGVNHLPVITAFARRRRRRVRRAARAGRRPERPAGRPSASTCPRAGLGELPTSDRRSGPSGDLLDQHQREARAVRALRRAARRRRPPPRRVLPRLPHRGVGLGRALGRAAHHDRGPRERRQAAPRRRVRGDARGDRGVARCRRARWSRR